MVGGREFKGEKFRQWQYEAVQKQEVCQGVTTPLDKYKDRLGASVPNRI